MVVLGWQLHLMILQIFSNLHDSMILWFYNSIIKSSLGSEFTTVQSLPCCILD